MWGNLFLCGRLLHFPLCFAEPQKHLGLGLKIVIQYVWNKMIDALYCLEFPHCCVTFIFLDYFPHHDYRKLEGIEHGI